MRGVRRSAAVFVSRGEGAQVLLVERSPELAFFGGFHAAPGGVLDANDARPIDPPSAEASGGDAAGELALRRCALRELFEETGMAPSRLYLGAPEERAALRRALLAEERTPGDGHAAWNRRLDESSFVLDELAFLCRLTTPPFAARRYQTDFFRLQLPPEQSFELCPGELVGGAFVEPEEALQRWRTGALRIVPPVLSMLEMWAAALQSGAFPEFLHGAARAAAERMESGLPRLSRNSPGVGFLPLATPTLPPATTTNCYFVGGERVYVVDPATYDESERERLFHVLTETLGSGVDLAGVLVTHHHADHVGSVAAVAERFGLEVLAHELTLARLPEAPARSRALRDGDRLPLGLAPDGAPDWELEVLHTPGHDRGHLAFRESRYGALIAGDLVSTLSTIVIDPPEGHLATYLATLARVAAADVGMVYPAHGPPHPDGKRLLETYLRHRSRREAKLVAALGRGSAPAPGASAAAARSAPVLALGELLEAVYDDVDRRMHGVARRSLLAGLEKLVEEGRALEADGGWVLAEHGGGARAGA